MPNALETEDSHLLPPRLARPVDGMVEAESVSRQEGNLESGWSLIFDIETNADASSATGRTLAFKRGQGRKPKRAG